MCQSLDDRRQAADYWYENSVRARAARRAQEAARREQQARQAQLDIDNQRAPVERRHAVAERPYDQQVDYVPEPQDQIAHPNHYTWHPKIECKDVVQEFDYNLGVAIAYIWRCNHKGTKVADLRKAIQHLEFEIARTRGIEL